MEKFDINKVRHGALVQTYEGTDITILTTEAPGRFPIIGYSQPYGDDSEPVIDKWTIDGRYNANRNSKQDLCMKRIEEITTEKFTVFPEGFIKMYDSLELAQSAVEILNSKFDKLNTKHRFNYSIYKVTKI